MNVVLNEESLKKDITDVFEISSKIGKGSYGSVYKAFHREKNAEVAIKKIPIDSDLLEIVKEISIMQQCDSTNIVKYYGSYFKGSDLYIIMEYCGGGSVSDIMKLLGKPLDEDKISIILHDTLKGLEYLHLKKKIHRDIKAGNILLDLNGHSKLADFGVAGQLSDAYEKRNTVIGTPYWMSPEIISEIGYDCSADIWSLGITCIEIYEGKPPYSDIHPMRVIFMIPAKQPPTLKDQDNCSPKFVDFISKCLVKNPRNRASASDLLQHEFIKNCQSVEIMKSLIQEANQIRYSNELEFKKRQLEYLNQEAVNKLIETNNSNETNDYDSNNLTLINKNNTLTSSTEENKNKNFQTVKSNYIPSDEEGDMGTMIINENSHKNSSNNNPDNEEKHETAGTFNSIKINSSLSAGSNNGKNNAAFLKDYNPVTLLSILNKSSAPSYPLENQQQLETEEEQSTRIKNLIHREVKSFNQTTNENNKTVSSDKLSYIYNLSCSDIKLRLKYFDSQMQDELNELKKKFEKKRQTILEAIEIKKKDTKIF